MPRFDIDGDIRFIRQVLMGALALTFFVGGAFGWAVRGWLK